VLELGPRAFAFVLVAASCNDSVSVVTSVHRGSGHDDAGDDELTPSPHQGETAVSTDGGSTLAEAGKPATASIDAGARADAASCNPTLLDSDATDAQAVMTGRGTAIVAWRSSSSHMFASRFVVGDWTKPEQLSQGEPDTGISFALHMTSHGLTLIPFDDGSSLVAYAHSGGAAERQTWYNLFDSNLDEWSAPTGVLAGDFVSLARNDKDGAILTNRTGEVAEYDLASGWSEPLSVGVSSPAFTRVVGNQRGDAALVSSDQTDVWVVHREGATGQWSDRERIDIGARGSGAIRAGMDAKGGLVLLYSRGDEPLVRLSTRWDPETGEWEPSREVPYNLALEVLPSGTALQLGYAPNTSSLEWSSLDPETGAWSDPDVLAAIPSPTFATNQVQGPDSFVVAWAERLEGPTGLTHRIYVRRFQESNAFWDPPLLLTEGSGAGAQLVVAGAANEFVVAWRTTNEEAVSLFACVAEW
jgi:hypothetical protein